ncbi:QUI-1 protein, partial [Aphelenchoides avenae]
VLVGHEDVVSCCGVSEDGKSVVSGGRDKAIIVWEVQTGTVRRSISAKAPVVAVEITFDGSVIVSADEGGWIEARSADNYRLLSSFNTHRTISQISISMDANRILAKLTNTAQLPILCLHNTPANVSMSNVHRRQHRIHSTTSFTSNVSGDEAWLSQQNAAGAKRASVASASGSGRRGSRNDAAVAGGSSQPALANSSPPSNADVSSGNPSTATAMTVGEDKSSNANSTTGSNVKANSASRSQKRSSMCCIL